MFKPTSVNTTYSTIIEKEQTIPPNIFITYYALAKMKQYVDQSDKEIGWLGYVDKTDDGYVISDVFLIEQEVTSVTTELKEDALNKHASELIKNGQFDKLEKVKCWGHSHVNMGVTPSGTDDNTFEEYYKNCEFFIRIVANKKGEMRVDIAETKRKIIFYNVKFIPLIPDEVNEKKKTFENLQNKMNEIQKEIDDFDKTYLKQFEKDTKEEIEKNVKTASTYKNNTNTTYGNYRYNYNYNDSDYNFINDYLYNDYEYNQTKDDDNKYQYYNPHSDAALYGCVPIFINTKEEDYQYISDILDFNEIYETALIGSAKDAKGTLKSRPEFKGYNDENWEDLVDACTMHMEEYAGGYEII